MLKLFQGSFLVTVLLFTNNLSVCAQINDIQQNQNPLDDLLKKAQISDSGTRKYFSIYLISGPYKKLNWKKFNPDKAPKTRTLVVSGDRYEIDLEKQLLKVNVKKFGFSARSHSPTLEMEPREISIPLKTRKTRWQTVIVLEQVMFGDDTSNYQTIYGFDSSSLECCYRLIQPRQKW
jgi:hypothetical protein